MKDNPETNQSAIRKAIGLTLTERYLARRAERSFLNLWSYPNPYRDQGQPGTGDGKELCDLLVVCGRDIIVFSEKSISWPKGDVTLAWRRWAKRALVASTRQVKGAERWIMRFPERIFLDRRCTQPFPIDLPETKTAVVHCVVVARGAGEASKRHFREGMGSLRMRPEILGDQHCSPDAELFAVGDLDPSGSFVHVIDDATLDILLDELDTIVDFTGYLTKKATFVRSGSLRSAAGEQDLLAHYAIRMNEEGEHDFVEREQPRSPLELGPGLYERFVGDQPYLARKEANQISYLWDRLIETFTSHLLDGTSVSLDGHDYNLRQSEIGIRYLALQNRVARRQFGAAVAGALLLGAETDRFFRRMIVPLGQPDCETGFFVQTMKYLAWMKSKGGYEAYRRVRTNLALVYAKGMLVRHPHLARVVGISCEPAAQGKGGSEDLIYVEQAHWSDHEEASIEEDCRRLGLLQPGVKEHYWREDEFPDV